MSRYDLRPRPERTHIIRAVIGWDRPLGSFFAQVFAAPDGEEEAVLWEGTAPDELATAEAAIALVRPYALVPDGLAERLEADRRATAGIADSPAQAAMKRFLDRG